MHIASLTAAAFSLLILVSNGLPAQGAEVKVIAGGPLAAVFNELGPKFERETGHKLVIRVAATATVQREIDSGETFDVAISATPAIDGWINQGKIVAATRVTVVHSGLGLAVRTGLPKPEIDSVEKFRIALLNAKSLAHNTRSASAADFIDMLERLGIAQEMQSRLKPISSGTVPNSVLNGEAEFGITTIPTILATSGVDLAGPLPAELQTYVNRPGFRGGCLV
jgi:molybdate transport system substrate-binding protein